MHADFPTDDQARRNLDAASAEPDYDTSVPAAPRHDERAAQPEAPQADATQPSTGQTDSGATLREVQPRVVATDRSLDKHQGQGVTGGTWIALILGTLILILLLIFILQNNVPARFAYFGWEFSLPLGVAMLFAAIAGVLITGLLGSVRLFKLSRRVRKLEKERQAIKQAMR